MKTLVVMMWMVVYTEVKPRSLVGYFEAINTDGKPVMIAMEKICWKFPINTGWQYEKPNAHELQEQKRELEGCWDVSVATKTVSLTIQEENQ